MTARPWRITLFDQLRIVGCGKEICRFRTQKTGALLAYLAFHLGSSHPREVLTELFWPDTDLAAARNSLSVALTSLRCQVEPPGTPAQTVIRADRFQVSLNPAAVTTDVREFEEALRAARKATGSPRAELLHTALNLYSGPLLPGFYDDWITPEQERLGQLAFTAALELVQHLESMGELGRAVEFASRAVSWNPLREDGYHSLMRLFVAQGQNGSALETYRTLERVLQAELGQEPSRKLRQYAREIVEGSGAAPNPCRMYSPTASGPPHLTRPTALGDTALQTVTFLFVHIENEGLAGAQDLEWAQKLEAAQKTLEREAKQGHGREVRKAQGTSFFLFGSAREAATCAMAVQRALLRENAQGLYRGPSARMVLHTGDIEDHQGTFPELYGNWGSSILTAATGGQIILSEATASLLKAGAADGICLRPLGEYRLRGLPAPEPLYLLEYPGHIPTDFPLRRLDVWRSPALPVQPNRFFGRRGELTHLTALLRSEQTRLVTVTGPGGTGKTRLAIEAARQLLDAWQGRVWFVDLGEIQQASLLAQRILGALGVTEAPEGDLWDQVAGNLAPAPSFLILDNFEQILPEGAAVVAELLTRVPTLTCLVTSRHLLQLPVERPFILAPLPTPDGSDSPDQLSLYDSVQLFVDRAQSVRPDFQITNSNAAAVAALCAGLEGIPLALELAAARVQVLTPAQMLAQIPQRFELLVSRRHNMAERHRTLWNAVAWSYHLLPPDLQEFFARTSVFRGSWTAEAAEVVCSAPIALDWLAELREWSLITASEGPGGMRFRMLDTVREFAQECIESTVDHAAVRSRHADYFAARVQQLGSCLRGHSAGEYLELLDADYPNIRAALDALGIQDVPRAIHLATELFPFWAQRGYWTEGRSVLQRFVDARDQVTLEDWEAYLRALSSFARVQGDRVASLQAVGALVEECRNLKRPAKLASALALLADLMPDREATQALEHALEAVSIWEQAGDASAAAGALLLAAWLAFAAGEPGQALDLGERGLKCAHASGDTHCIAVTTADLGVLAIWRDDLVAAQSYAEVALPLFREAGDELGVADTLGHLAGIARRHEDWGTAEGLLMESLALSRALGHKNAIASRLRDLGNVEFERSSTERADALFREALLIFRDLQYRDEILHVLMCLARTALAMDQDERAAVLLGAVQGLWVAQDQPAAKTTPTGLAEMVETLRQRIGEKFLSQVGARGRRLGLYQAVTYALNNRA